MSAGNRGGPSGPLLRAAFGAFELDVRAGELRKHGAKIRLQEQPFRVLLMLLDRPGEVVLREEIRKKLWPNDTIVEFAPSINAAIQRLRDALGIRPTNRATWKRSLGEAIASSVSYCHPPRVSRSRFTKSPKLSTRLVRTAFRTSTI